MLVSKLVPLLVMGGIGIHSGGAIKNRMMGAVDAKEKIVAKQRISAIFDAAILQAASGETIDAASPAAFRKWVKNAVRVKNGSDPGLDPWGTPLKASYNGTTFTITSAGADKKFGSKDDVKASSNIHDI